MTQVAAKTNSSRQQKLVARTRTFSSSSRNRCGCWLSIKATRTNKSR